jgi:hypothetical protein
MPRTCTVCSHDDRAEIDKALVAGEPLRNVAKRFGTSAAALNRHKGDHIPAILAAAERRAGEQRGDGLLVQATEQRDRENQYGIDLRRELQRCFERANLLFDACDRWLRDPDDPTRYDVGPRADDVAVVYWGVDTNGKPTREKARLSTLLARLGEAKIDVDHWETKHADPRELLLKTTAQLKSQLELVAKLVGDLDERPTVNVLLDPQWLTLRTTILGALSPFPDARAAVAARLVGLEASNGHSN